MAMTDFTQAIKDLKEIQQMISDICKTKNPTTIK